MIFMDAATLWNHYTKDPTLSYTAWSFGVVPDKLAALVVAGTKQATTSLYDLYAVDQEPLPMVGGYSVILNSKEEAVCIVQTTKVTILPFQDVTEEMADIEGEGDRSLAYWRDVHLEFFQEEAKTIGKTFDESMFVVFEEFQLVYPI